VILPKQRNVFLSVATADALWEYGYINKKQKKAVTDSLILFTET
jgi:hypothetical protein